MKGLLLKDFYVILKQLKIYIVMIVVFAAVSVKSEMLAGLAVAVAAVMPITALSYDERSHWDTLAAMMPYTARDMVLCKYILGYAYIAFAAGLSIIVHLAAALFIGGAAGLSAYFMTMLITACAATILISLELPFMFRLGVEKARIVYLIGLGLMMLAATTSAELSQTLLANGAAALDAAPVPLVAAAAVVLTVLINLLSINISIKMYAAKRA